MNEGTCLLSRIMPAFRWLIPCLMLAFCSAPLLGAVAASPDRAENRADSVVRTGVSMPVPSQTAKMQTNAVPVEEERPQALPDAEPRPRQLENGASVKLSPTLVSGGDVVEALLSYDGTTVVYLADQETDELFELYSVPIDGSGTETKINAPLAPTCSIDGNPCPSGTCPDVGTCSAGGGYCESDVDCPGMMNNCQNIQPQTCDALGAIPYFSISPDGARVVYQADQETDEVLALFSAPIDGSSPPTKLSQGSTFPGKTGITPDSTRVLYVADQDTSGVFELYSVPIDGSSTAIKLNGTLTPGGAVQNFGLSPDSTKVVYYSDQDVDNTFELYSAPVDGSAAAVKLNLSGATGGGTIAPNSATFVYYLACEPTPCWELYAVPIDGPASSSLQLVDDTNVGHLEITPDSTRVVYYADHDTVGVTELYSVPIDGSSTHVKLSGPMQPDGDVGWMWTAMLSPDSAMVVYRADQNLDEVWELFCAPIDGSAPPITLQEATEPDADVGTINPGGAPIYGERSVFILTGAGNWEPCSCRIDGGQSPTALNDPLPSGGGIHRIYMPGLEGPLGQDATILAYAGEQETIGVDEGYIAPIYGNLPPTKFNDTLVEGGNVVWPIRINSDETYVVYTADQDTDEVFELYSRAIDTDADGVSNLTDNCPRTANATQAAVVFGQQVVAASETEFSWPVTQDVDYVRGPLSQVDVYATNVAGSMLDAVSYSDTADPGAGAGWYYLFAIGADCAVGSWQSTPGGEPQRDVTLP